MLGRARYQAVGRFGLRASPGGFETPAFGDDHAVVRVAGSHLAVERGSSVNVVAIDGASLSSLAALAGAALDAEFVAGGDAPALGDPDEPLAVDADAAGALAAWYDLGWRALDGVLADLGPQVSPSRIQLWPEHFDVACDVAVGPGEADRCNLGASPGDEAHPTPYLYVGPWGERRPGDARYWNVPFGAVLDRDEVGDLGVAVRFLRRGVDQLRG